MPQPFSSNTTFVTLGNSCPCLSTETFFPVLRTSRIDYCNSLLYGLPNNLISKLECVLSWSAFKVHVLIQFGHDLCSVLSVHFYKIYIGWLLNSTLISKLFPLILRFCNFLNPLHFIIFAVL